MALKIRTEGNIDGGAWGQWGPNQSTDIGKGKKTGREVCCGKKNLGYG
jgi:hypothetical protein